MVAASLEITADSLTTPVEPILGLGALVARVLGVSHQGCRSLVSTSKTEAVSLVTPVDIPMELHVVEEVVLPMLELLVEEGTSHQFSQVLAASTPVPQIPKGSTPDPTLIKVLSKTLPQDLVIIQVSTKDVLTWSWDLVTPEGLTSLTPTLGQVPTATKGLIQPRARLRDLITTIRPELVWVQHLVTKEISTRVLAKVVQDQTIVEGLIQALQSRLQDKPTIEDTTLALVGALIQIQTEEEDNFLILGLGARVKDIRLLETLVVAVRELILPQEVKVPRAVKEAILHLMEETVLKGVTLLLRDK